MSGKKIYGWVCRAGDQRAVIGLLTNKQLRKLIAWLLRRGCVEGFGGEVLAMCSTELMARFLNDSKFLSLKNK